MTMQSSRTRPEQSVIEQEAVGRELCRAHAEALLTIAILALDDPQEAVDTVAEAIAAASRSGLTGDVGRREVRQQLARSVFDRSRGRLVARERFAEAPAARGAPDAGQLPRALRALDANRRAVVALAVFGQHGLREAATTLSLTPDSVVTHLRDALRVANDTLRTNGPPLPDASAESTGDVRYRRQRASLHTARQRFDDDPESSRRGTRPEDGPGPWVWDGPIVVPAQRSGSSASTPQAR